MRQLGVFRNEPLRDFRFLSNIRPFLLEMAVDRFAQRKSGHQVPPGSGQENEYSRWLKKNWTARGANGT
jgi:hypothetical protein